MRSKFHQRSTTDLYVTRIFAYQGRLVNTQQMLTDEDVITNPLTTLLSSYNVAKEVIYNRPNRTVALVIASLRRHWGFYQK